MEPIPFNKPHLTGKEYWFINRAVKAGQLCGNNVFTRRCNRFFERRYGFRKALLTTSCTDALEMAAILTGVGPGDEVIVPSYTFVSSALAFVRQGAKVVFADSYATPPPLLQSQRGPREHRGLHHAADQSHRPGALCGRGV